MGKQRAAQQLAGERWDVDFDAQRVEEVMCDLDGYPGWVFRAEVEETPTGLQIRRLVIEPTADVPAGGISTRMLQRIRTGDLLVAHRQAVKEAALYVGIPDLNVSHRAGRAGRDDLYYAEWAAEYVAALSRSSRPVREMARKHGKPLQTMTNLVKKCRDKEMLTPTTQGRPGGQLTERAKELLEEKH
jgi:hypothetical protein